LPWKKQSWLKQPALYKKYMLKYVGGMLRQASACIAEEPDVFCGSFFADSIILEKSIS